MELRRRGRVIYQEGGITLVVPPDPRFRAWLNRHVGSDFVKYQVTEEGVFAIHIAAPGADAALERAQEVYELEEWEARDLTIKEVRELGLERSE